jgi:ribonuclease BN (tRNA processing enzyme)
MYYNTLNLQKIEKGEQIAYKKQRAAGHTHPHKAKGNFIAMLGRQYKPFFKNDIGFKPLHSGFYIKYHDLELMVDPGVNTLDRAQKIGVNLYRANGLFISHAHSDHDNDANIVVEIASNNGEKFDLLASKEALGDRTVKPWHIEENTRANIDLHKLSDESITLFKEYALKPIKTYHSIDGSFGFVLDLDGIKIGYTGDSGFTKKFKTTESEYVVGNTEYSGEILGPTEFNNELKSVFANVDILIFNLHNFSYCKSSVFHSTAFDLIEILKDSKVKLCICDHFNPNSALHKKYSGNVIEFIKQKSEKNVVLVPNQGLVVKLDKFAK